MYYETKATSIAPPESQLRVSVLGNFQATFEGRTINPTAAKPRQVLAILALRSNQIVPFSTLVDELWGEDIPSSAKTTMQTYILQIRRLIATAASADGRGLAKKILATSYDGYVLNMDPHRLDARRYSDLTSTGLNCLGAHRFDEAERVLSEAESLWRGPALVDVRRGEQLALECHRLDELRLMATEVRFEALIKSGRSQVALADLGACAAQHPFHERLHSLHMVALAENGRTSQALTVFNRLRAVLIEELGFEPSMPVQLIYQDLLHGRTPRLHCAAGLAEVERGA